MASVLGSHVLETIAQKLSFGVKRRVREHPQVSVVKLIETEIIPRMLVAHETPVEPGSAEAAHAAQQSALLEAEVRAFCELPLELDADRLIASVESYLQRGVSIEAVYVDLLAPAARHLGRLWEEDRTDFIDVTMGLWRLQEVLRELSDRAPRLGAGAAHRALFAPMPGDQHSFGTAIVQEVFAQRGWETDYVGECDRGDLFERAATERFDLIGLTVSRDCHTDELSSLIRALRSVSSNQNLCVMIGGRVPASDPLLATRCGADGAADDPREAALIAERLVGERQAVALG